MGVRNYLIEGVSGTGKTSVCTELERRGYQAIHGDRVLSYRGNPATGEPLGIDPGADPDFVHRHHLWDIDKVRALAADRTHPVTFFCGGSRNYARFIALFDAVFVLELDSDSLNRRLDLRTNEWGSAPAERALILRLHASGEDVPAAAVGIDATAPLAQVVDDILSRCGESGAAHQD